MEGEFLDLRTRDDYRLYDCERSEVKKYADNLNLEDEFGGSRPHDDYKEDLGERPEMKKHPNNLKPEGEFSVTRTRKTINQQQGINQHQFSILAI
jgi:hypothetical protein